MAPNLMTFAEFDKIPDPEGPYYLELHHGEPVQLLRPVLGQSFAQGHLVKVLDAVGPTGIALPRLGFRPLPEYEHRVADVAYASKRRWADQNVHGQFMGVPDLVVEFLSPAKFEVEM